MDVLDLNVELGTVERRLTDTYLVWYFKVIENFLHCSLCLVPLLGRADIFFAVIGIPLREAVGDILIKSEGFEHIYRQLKAALELVLKLFGCAHEVTFGNGELAHTDKSMHLSAGLVAEKGGGLVISQRQVSV